MKIVGGEAGSKVYYDDQGKRYDLSDWVEPGDTLGFGYGKGSHVFTGEDLYDLGMMDFMGNPTGFRPTRDQIDQIFKERERASQADPLGYAGRYDLLGPARYQGQLYYDDTTPPAPYSPEEMAELIAFRQSRERPGPKGGFTSWGGKALSGLVGGGITALSSIYGGPLVGAGVGGLVTKMMNPDADIGDVALGAGLSYLGSQAAPYLSSATGLSPAVSKGVTDAVITGAKTGIQTGDWRAAALNSVLSGVGKGIDYGTGAVGDLVSEGTKTAGQELAERIASGIIKQGVRYGTGKMFNSLRRR